MSTKKVPPPPGSDAPDGASNADPTRERQAEQKMPGRQRRRRPGATRTRARVTGAHHANANANDEAKAETRAGGGTQAVAPPPPDTEPVLDVALDDAESTEDTRREAPPDGGSSPRVVREIRELEAQLDRLIDEASRRDVASLADLDEDEAASAPGPAPAPGPGEGEPPPSVDTEVGAESSRQRPSAPPYAAEPTVFDTARELLSTDFYLRKWGRLAMRNRSEEVDDFGYDPIYDAKLEPLLAFLYAKYFRVTCHGIDAVPTEGRCLLIANHSGTVPLDGIMLKMAMKREHAAHREMRWLTEDFIYHFPFLGSIVNRLGAVRACQENAERLLSHEELVAVFPEGVKGIGKLFAERYRLQRFGRGGFLKLALRTSTPIVPVAIVGAEETNPILFRIEALSKALGVPYLPVTPTFPLLGPAGLLPAPTKWEIHFGEALDFSSYGPEAADDEILVGKLAERVRATIQGMLDRAVGGRKSVFFG